MEQTNEEVHVVGLSATLPEYQVVATFFHLDASYQPCGLQQQFIGFKLEFDL